MALGCMECWRPHSIATRALCVCKVPEGNPAANFPAVPQVMFICEQLKFGNSVMDEKSDISFTTAVSRQLRMPHRNGKQTQLVAAMQLKVCITMQAPLVRTTDEAIREVAVYGDMIMGQLHCA